MSIGVVSLLLIALLVGQMVIGVPLAFATGSTAVVLALTLFGIDSLLLVVNRIQDMIGNYSLISVPLFILMGSLLERGGVTEQLFRVVQLWFGRLPGGLAVGVIIAGTVLAAMVGIAGAEIVTLGLVALPALLRRGYDKGLSLGTICASGSLGAMIPPSVVLIIYGLVANASISALFAAALIPGILMAVAYCAYVIILCTIKPHMAPRESGHPMPLKQRLVESRSVAFPLVVILAVLGSIYGGIATPTEAAGIGVLGALIAAALNHRLTLESIRHAIRQTGVSIGTVIWIFFGANALISVYSLAGGLNYINDLILGIDLPPMSMVLVMVAVLFALGMLIDWIGIALLTMPIFVPIVVGLGYDVVWFGVVFCVVMQTSYLTPPFGPAAFYLRGVAPSDITLGDIFRSVWPFIAIQLSIVVLLLLVPDIALWLPRRLATAP